MNELEIAQWSLIKELTADFDYHSDEELQLFLTAFHAKVGLSLSLSLPEVVDQS